MITLYHNPDCGTSRNVLALIRHAGLEPHVIEYLKTPPTRARLIALIAEMGITPRALLRTNVPPYHALGMANPALSDAEIIDAMLAHPLLINRPIVVSEKGVKLCRPSEEVLSLLPACKTPFIKENGEIIG